MPFILFVSFALAISFYIVQPLADPDIWWHVVSGRWIISHHAVPREDYWTMFASGQPWTAYSWSNEVVYAAFDRWFGLEGLLSLQLLLAFVFTISVFWALGKIAGNYVLGALLGSLVVAGSHAHYSLRPQSLTWILLALTLLLAENINRDGFSRKRALALAALFCVWANTHITTVIGLGALCAWTLPRLPWQPKELSTGLKAVGVAFLGTLCTPYFGYEWKVFFATSAHPMLFSSIQEFAPASILHVPTVFLVVLSVLAGVFYAMAVSIVRPFQLLGAGVLVLGSLAVIKFLPYALIFLAFIVAKQWRSIGAAKAEKRGLIDALQKLDLFVRRIPKEGLSFVFLCLAAVNANNTWHGLIDSVALPVKAIDFIQEKNWNGPIMNTFGQGGYLSYRFADPDGNAGVKVAIDGRTNLISHDLWESYQKSWLGKRDWASFLEMVKPETILWRSDSPLPRILEAQGSWCEVFHQAEERSAVVLRKCTQTQ